MNAAVARRKNPEFHRMPIKLKGLILALGMSQRDWSARIKQANGQPLSYAAGQNIINYDIWPKLTTRDEIVRQNAAMLRSMGIDQEAIDHCWEWDAEDNYRGLRPVGCYAGNGRKPANDAESIPEDTTMLLRAESLRPQTRKHFKFMQSPFAEDVQSAEDIFMWPDYRYAREALWDAARNGAFRAIVGESGSGKTTLVEELRERIRTEGHEIVLIEPYVVGMESNDRKGRQLKSAQIAEAVVQSLAPNMPIKQTPDARFRQAHELLKESARAGYRHLLLIEEAHALPLVTLKHLKRWRELKDGLRSLLGIALVGQPELQINLDERNPQVREVVQRCEMVTLMPLDDSVEKYIGAKFARVNLNPAEVFEPGFGDAIRKRLTFAGGRRGAVSMLYPLAVNNLVARAMNAAAEHGAARVDAQIIGGA